VIDVPMILESEWNLKVDEVEADFSKLLLGRADRRVMVFQQRDATRVKEGAGWSRRDDVGLTHLPFCGLALQARSVVRG
jgi:hypothetical protein